MEWPTLRTAACFTSTFLTTVGLSYVGFYSKAQQDHTEIDWGHFALCVGGSAIAHGLVYAISRMDSPVNQGPGAPLLQNVAPAAA